MDRLTNVEVKFAKVTDGKSAKGKWKMCKFTITDPNWDGIWFGWFLGEGKPEPAVGMEIAELEYEVETKGEYTNYNAKKLIVAEGSAPQSNPKPKPQTTTGSSATASSGGNGQAYINHGECVVEIMQMTSVAGVIDRPNYEKLLNAFKFGIRVLTTETAPAKTKPETEPAERFLDPDDLPF